MSQVSAGLGGFPVGVVDRDEAHVGQRDDVNLVETFPAADGVAGAALVAVDLQQTLKHEEQPAPWLVG